MRGRHVPTLSRSTGTLVAGLLALALTAGLVIRTSSAVFTAQTDNTGNSVEAGTVVLSDDDGGTALLTMTNIAPGEFSRECIVVTYDGTLDPEPVRVFSTSSFSTSPAATGPGTAATTMQAWVNITIEQGADADCTTFSGTTIVPSTPLDDWHAATSGGYDAGAGTWDPGAGPVSRAYRITLELDETTGNDFQGAGLTGINLSWGTESTNSPGEVTP